MHHLNIVKKKSLLILSGIFIFLIIITFVMYFKYKKSDTNIISNQNIGNTNYSLDIDNGSDQNSILNTPINTLLPASWTYYKSQKCGVIIPVPDNSLKNSNALDANRQWKINEKVIDPSPDIQNLFTNKVNLNFLNNDINSAPSDYEAAAVFINCVENTRLTLSQAFTKLQLYTTNNNSNSNYAHLNLEKIKQIQRWGKDVIVYKFTGGYEYSNENDYRYMVVTPFYIYELQTISNSKSMELFNIRAMIFNNIKFF